MNKLHLLTTVAAFAATAAAPGLASADVSGNVSLTGLVTSKCVMGVEAPGSTGASSFAHTIALGELDGADGRISSTLTSQVDTASSTTTFSTRVVCNTTNPTVAITDSELIDSSLVVSTGYANAINYSADVIATTTSGNVTVGPATTNGATNGSVSATALGNPLAASGNNIEVVAFGFATVGSNADILLSSGGSPDYTGTINVVIAPGS